MISRPNPMKKTLSYHHNQYPYDFGYNNIAVDDEGDVGNADSDSGGNGTYVDSVNGNGGSDSGDSESDERCDAGDGNASDDSVSEDGDKASSHHSPNEEECRKKNASKVPKTKGTGSRDFSIREHLGLDTGEEDDKQIYKEILCSVHDWSSQILNTDEPMREQDNHKVSLVVQHVLEECPELNHFERIWPIKVLIQQFLKNSSELKRASARRREEQLARLPCEEPQALSVANTSKSAVPVSSSKFTTSKSASAKKKHPSKVSSKVGFCEQRDCLAQGFDDGCQEVLRANWQVNNVTRPRKGSMTGARKSSEPTGKISTTGAMKPCANFRLVGNHDQATSSMKRKTPEDGKPSVPVAKCYKTLEDVPAPMHAKRLQAASKAGATNKSAPRKTAPKTADPKPRKSKRQLLPTCTLPTDSGSSHILLT
ncbi:hypothetical protein JB92DRAFT_3207070 [Gautieria morchelliformis]|nr:hypothetical protein JB92DRAFT_3207070 [Gautieria morchelliformis]